MKKKLLGMLAVFALVVTGIFGFVGCKNKDEAKGLTEEDLIGTYSASVISISATDGTSTVTSSCTREQFATLDNTNQWYETYSYMFGATYEVKADKTIVATSGTESEQLGTWSIENGELKVVVNEEAEAGNFTVSYNNGTLTVVITDEDAGYTITMTETLTKNA